jgi:DNA-3-methyladenine glycosylase
MPRRGADPEAHLAASRHPASIHTPGASLSGLRSPDPPPLPARFFARPAEEIAYNLLGCLLTSECAGDRVSGRVVETEAYVGPDDPASHAAERIGRTARNDPMFGPAGTAYIHMNYGIHWLLNVVTGKTGHPAAVLIRALEPQHGQATMRARRGRPELTNGPARLAQALAIGPEVQRHPLDRPPLWLSPGDPVPPEAVWVGPRVGISRGADRELRFYDRRSRWVSRR